MILRFFFMLPVSFLLNCKFTVSVFSTVFCLFFFVFVFIALALLRFFYCIRVRFRARVVITPYAKVKQGINSESLFCYLIANLKALQLHFNLKRLGTKCSFENYKKNSLM